MADDAYAAYTADDAILLNLVRTGEAEAYEVLRQRHEQAARRLARCLVPADDADNVAAEAFAWVRDITLRGGGPADAFRPYLLTAVRRLGYDRLHPEDAGAPAGTDRQPDPGELFIKPGMADRATSLIVRAFRSLPDRWIAVLWHTKIEETGPEEITQILGLSPHAVAALVEAARKGLREAYLQLLISDVARPECQPAARRLADIVTGTAANHDRVMVTEHLGHCDECRAAYNDLTDLNIALRSQAAPVFLGSAADSYLPNVQAPAASTAASAAATETAPEQAAATSSPKAPTGQSRRITRRMLWAAAGIVPFAAVATALAVTFAGPGSPSNSAHRNQSAQAAAAPTPASTTGQPAHKRQQNGAPAIPETATKGARPTATTGAISAHPGTPGTGHSGGSPTSSPAPGTPAELTMSITLSDLPDDPNPGAFNSADIAIDVTGAATTGDLTVSLTLPPGTSLWSGPGAVSAGWTCRQTAAGASCQTGPVAEGNDTRAAIIISVSIPASCGDLVEASAVSGRSSTSGPSDNGVQC